MAIVEYLKAFRRRWILILGCFLLATAIGYVLSPEEPSEPEGAGFEASQTLIPAPEAATAGTVNLHLAAHLATGPDVARLAKESLPASVEAPKGNAVTAAVSPEAGSLIIRVTHQDRTQAGLVAQAYSTATIEFFQASTVESQDEALEDARAELEAIAENLSQLQQQLANNPDDVVIQAQVDGETTRYSETFQRVQDLVDAEDPPASLQVLGTAEVVEIDPGFIQAPDDRRVRALLVGAVGMLLGLGLAITVDRLDTRLRERDEVEDAFGLQVLAEIPTVGRRARANHALVAELKPDSPAADAYRSLRSAITLISHSGHSTRGTERDNNQSDPPQVLVVAGADGSQGKSTTVVNLAAVIAESGRSVLVIDCDFRKPEAHEFLDAKPRSTLANLVTGRFSGYLDQMVRKTSVQGVELVSSIEPVREHTQAVSQLPALIAEARKRADVVLIDSSPLLVTSDAVDVLHNADAALVACRVGQTTYNQAKRSRRLLQRSGVEALGIVLTGTPRRRGTPYGQPSRSERLWGRLMGWLGAPGPDRFEDSVRDRSSSIREPHERPAPESAAPAAPQPPSQPRMPERPAPTHARAAAPERATAAEPLERRPRPSVSHDSPRESHSPVSQTDERQPPEPVTPERVELDDLPTMEFSTVEAAAAASGDPESAYYRSSRERRTFEERAESAARKFPPDSSSE